MKILVTGGAGFIGSHTTERLLAAGHDVRVVDDLSTGNMENLAGVVDEIEFQELDIRDRYGLDKMCDGIETVIHLAAVSSVEKSTNEPILAHDVNASGTMNVIDASRQNGVRRLIFSSSAAVYGDHPELPKTEESPTHPVSPYAWQKLTGEFYGRSYSGQYDMDFLALRYFNVYGPRQDPSSSYSGVLSIFVERSKHGNQLKIFGDGRQTRDFINVSDVAEVNLLAVESQLRLPGIINISTGTETSISEVAGIVQDLSSSMAGIDYSRPRADDIMRSYASNDLLKDSLGYKPRVELRDGLAGLIAAS